MNETIAKFICKCLNFQRFFEILTHCAELSSSQWVLVFSEAFTLQFQASKGLVFGDIRDSRTILVHSVFNVRNFTVCNKIFKLILLKN